MDATTYKNDERGHCGEVRQRQGQWNSSSNDSRFGGSDTQLRRTFVSQSQPQMITSFSGSEIHGRLRRQFATVGVARCCLIPPGPCLHEPRLEKPGRVSRMMSNLATGALSVSFVVRTRCSREHGEYHGSVPSAVGVEKAISRQMKSASA